MTQYKKGSQLQLAPSSLSVARSTMRALPLIRAYPSATAFKPTVEISRNDA